MTPDDLDPEIRAFQRQVTAEYERHGSPVDVADRRRIAGLVRERWNLGGPVMASTVDLHIGGVTARLHRPDDAPDLPVLVYLHGGGWVLFSIDTHDRLMREYAARSGCAVLGVNYSLSPEARYPQALEEVHAALEWLRAEGAAFGLDPRRIAIGGDSAGGNLAVATALRLRDAGQDWLGAVLVNYGAFDTEPRASHGLFQSDDYILNPEEMAAFWTDYLGETDRDDPYARPLLADLAGLPPTFLCIAECDILADENREMAARLAAAGVPVEARLYAGATHSFIEAVGISPLAARAIDDGARWLAAQLRP
ncbi:alpha/beta hydrolase [Sphingomonas sp. QA11]|uniref:alpha/beta hydrolase n=1 Tax=Sphingomonas sp. QA11 TaxID=2950605 RepID=UPI00234B4D3C|nr:alpha/beta hydrolase [Sphingomonas sp. QA11]WCM25634.1 alpha/beta hydrolase [Sphingomonas sp. QA11]